MRLFVLILALMAATPARAHHWVRTWAAAPNGAGTAIARTPLPDLKDRTLRQIVRISVAGNRLRLVLSNAESDVPVAIRAVRIALATDGAEVGAAQAGGAIVPGSVHAVTFSGRSAISIPAFSPMLSDPVAMPVRARARIAIDLYFAADAPRATGHDFANATGWIAPGDQTGSARLHDTTRYMHRLTIGALDVDRARPAATVVALGDSITDGGLSSLDADRRWPDRLAERLDRAGMTAIAVANAGISGNRLSGEGSGHGALARFDRDVIAVPGVRHVIVLLGINDIVRGAEARPRALPSADDLIAGFRQMIVRGHAAGLKVHLATITPYRVDVIGADGEAVRQTVNRWIRTNGEADGAIDFDHAIRDPANPSQIAAVYDSGDTLHPNDAGMVAMAAAVDLTKLR